MVITFSLLTLVVEIVLLKMVGSSVICYVINLLHKLILLLYFSQDGNLILLQTFKKQQLLYVNWQYSISVFALRKVSH